MSGLWAWAVAVYASAPVAETLLALQDDEDQSPPLLLWAAWARPDADAAAAGAACARAWDSAAVRPLRQVRRALKQSPPGADPGAAEALRARVKATELEAERLLLAALEAIAQPAQGRPELTQALTLTARAWSGTAPPGLHALAAAIAAAETGAATGASRP
ncbi:MAG: TIGR02444 family protein [Caulobacteraceae bacterium]|nr:TIGR02444 family protein [Caulobacteraceae bacterium]